MTTKNDKVNMGYVEGFVAATGHKLVVNPYIYGLVKSKCGVEWTEKHLQQDVGVTRGEVVNPKISLCKNGCFCMTHTVNGKCGKCGEVKND